MKEYKFTPLVYLAFILCYLISSFMTYTDWYLGLIAGLWTTFILIVWIILSFLKKKKSPKKPPIKDIYEDLYDPMRLY